MEKHSFQMSKCESSLSQAPVRAKTVLTCEVRPQHHQLFKTCTWGLHTLSNKGGQTHAWIQSCTQIHMQTGLRTEVVVQGVNKVIKPLMRAQDAGPHTLYPWKASTWMCRSDNEWCHYDPSFFFLFLTECGRSPLHGRLGKSQSLFNDAEWFWSFSACQAHHALIKSSGMTSGTGLSTSNCRGCSEGHLCPLQSLAVLHHLLQLLRHSCCMFMCSCFWQITIHSVWVDLNMHRTHINPRMLNHYSHSLSSFLAEKGQYTKKLYPCTVDHY